MPEYFEISFISPLPESAKPSFKESIEKNISSIDSSLIKTEAREFLSKKEIRFYEMEVETDYLETCIYLSKVTFHKELFDQELKGLDELINACFALEPQVKLALCSYEINGYLLRDVRVISDLTDDVMKTFPIVYRRLKANENPIRELHLNAQDIFD